MLGQIDIGDPSNIELAQRIIVRMGDQKENEISSVLSKLFPNAPALRIKSVAEDLASKRINAEDEFLNLLGSDKVNREVFKALSSAEEPDALFSRSQYDPTKFELTLTCYRTPFKEFFDECKDITCESCIKSRITEFETNNQFSKSPWELKVDRQEQSRVNLCKGCGRILGKQDDLNMQNERLLYKCSKCGHRGWNQAK